jgi:hypothetical protein
MMDLYDGEPQIFWPEWFPCKMMRRAFENNWFKTPRFGTHEGERVVEVSIDIEAVAQHVIDETILFVDQRQVPMFPELRRQMYKQVLMAIAVIEPFRFPFDLKNEGIYEALVESEREVQQ